MARPSAGKAAPLGPLRARERRAKVTHRPKGPAAFRRVAPPRSRAVCAETARVPADRHTLRNFVASQSSAGPATHRSWRRHTTLLTSRVAAPRRRPHLAFGRGSSVGAAAAAAAASVAPAAASVTASGSSSTSSVAYTTACPASSGPATARTPAICPRGGTIAAACFTSAPPSRLEAHAQRAALLSRRAHRGGLLAQGSTRRRARLRRLRRVRIRPGLRHACGVRQRCANAATRQHKAAYDDTLVCGAMQAGAQRAAASGAAANAAAARTGRQQARGHDAPRLRLREAHVATRPATEAQRTTGAAPRSLSLSGSRDMAAAQDGRARLAVGTTQKKGASRTPAPRPRDAMAHSMAGSALCAPAVRVRRARAASRRPVTAASGTPPVRPRAAAAAAASLLAAAGPAVAAGGNAVAQVADASSVGLTLAAGGAIAGLAFLLTTTDPSKRCAARAQSAQRPRTRAQCAAARGRLPRLDGAALRLSDAPRALAGVSRWRRRLAATRWSP